MKKKINFTFLFLTIAFCFALVNNSFCQGNKLGKLDSLRNKLTADSAHIYRFKKLKPLFTIDTRNSFIHNSTSKIPVDFNGFQVGFIVHEKHSMGMGFYGMSHVLKTQPILSDQKKVININMNMGYVTSFYEYNVFETKRWEISIPSEFGIGNYQITATDQTGKRDSSFKDTLKRAIILFGTGFNVDFKVFKWVGLSLMGGYRIVLGNEPQKVDLNGIFYSFGLHFYVGEVLKWNKLRKKKNIYRKEVAKIISKDSFWERDKTKNR